MTLQEDQSKLQLQEDLMQVLEIARLMGNQRDLQPLLELIISGASRLLRAERASLFLYDAASDELYSKIAQKSEIGEIRFPAKAGIAGFIATHKACVNIPDAYLDPRFNPGPDKKTGFRTRSILGCPMLDLEGNLVGVLEVLNKADGVFNQYDEYMLSVLGAQAGVALDRARLQAQYRQKVEMERELSVARDIQQALLPKVVPVIAGFDLAGWSEPAVQTGGDIYDIFAIGTGLGFMLGDATGHGIGPALMISETRAVVRALAAQTPDLSAIMHGANELLSNDSTDGRFVTLLAGMIDVASGRIRLSSAGQGPNFLMRDGGRRIDTLEPNGLPLGIMSGPKWTSVELELQPGDLLVVVSDGIFECYNGHNEMLGTDKMLQRIKDCYDRPAAEIVRAIAELTETFAAGEPFRDDRTAVIVKRLA